MHRPSITFSSTVRCGSRLNRWNTIATLRRIAERLASVTGSRRPRSRRRHAAPAR
jgi:hypothetical protein